MAKIVNLNRARKTRTREEKRRKGTENAAMFGQTRTERDRNAQQKAAATRHLDGHHLGATRPNDDDAP